MMKTGPAMWTVLTQMSGDKDKSGDSEATRTPTPVPAGASTDLPTLVTQPGDSAAQATSLAPGMSAQAPSAWSEGASINLIGQTIGPYRIVAELGSGGMGAVYLAEQSVPVHRQVALKVIKAGMDSADLLERFRSERAMLARMNHPNIAQVLDVGTTSEARLYFAMEYVPGVPLDEFADRRTLDLRHRLELFLQVCEGVQHAHQKGVMHRDLKPNNLLVADYQGQLLVKIIDFGIAKNMDAFGRSEPGATSVGMPIGTPSYMSPEQATGDPAAIDTRTDVYSLGVVLYKLITNELPIPSDVIARAIHHDLAKTLREYEIKAPSRRVLEIANTGVTEWKRFMASDHVAHSRRLRGDLDWITLRALERERDRRYASVSEFAAEIRRYLDGEPVLAGPPSRRYRMQKFIERHRLAVGAAVAVVLSLIAGIIGTTWMAIEAGQQRGRAESALVAAEQQGQRAESESARALATSAFLQDMIAAPDPWKLSGDASKAREVKVIDALQLAAQNVDSRLVDNPELRAQIGVLLGRTFRRLGQLDAARRQLEAAVGTLGRGATADSTQFLEASAQLALTRLEQGEYQAAREALKGLLPKLVAGRGLEAGLIEEARRALADAALESGDIKAAKAQARENLESARREHGEDSSELSGAQASLAGILGADGEWEEANRMITEAFQAERRRLGPAHPRVLKLLSLAADLALREGNYRLAEQHYRDAALSAEQVLGAEHPTTLTLYAQAATTVSDGGDPAAAVLLFEQVLPRLLLALGADHGDVLVARANYGLALRLAGRTDDAERELGDVYQRRRRVLGETHPETMRTVNFLAAIANDRGDLGKAETFFRQAADLFAQANGRDHPEALMLQNNLYSTIRRRGDYLRAIEGYAELMPRAEKVLPAEHWHLAAIRGNYGESLYRAGRYEEAEPLIRASFGSIRAQFADTDPRYLGAKKRYDELYQLWKKPAPALP